MLITLIFAACFIVACEIDNQTLAEEPVSSSLPESLAPWKSSELQTGVVWHRMLGEDLRFGSHQAYHVIDVDLPAARVDVEFLWFFERTALVSMIANQVGAVAATNATYLGVDDQFFKSRGEVQQRIDAPDEDPREWSYEGAVFYDDEGMFGIKSGSRDEYEGMEWPGIISAGPLLVENHRLRGISPPERPSHEHVRHPRTAIAVTDGGERLFLVTIDGRAGEAAGLTTPELTALLREDFSVEGALNLDGGGTTMMWILGETPGGVVSRPSDNGQFDHVGERWTGQAIALIPEDPEAHLKPLIALEQNCVVSFSGREDHVNGEPSEQYIYLGDQLDGQMDMPAGQNFTFSLWIKLEPGDHGPMTLLNKRIADTSGGGTSRGYELLITPEGEPEAWFDNGESSLHLVSDTRLEEDRWSHVALRLEHGRASLWLNGLQVTESDDSLLADGFGNNFFLTAGARRAWALEDHQGRTHAHSPWGTPKFSFDQDPFYGNMDQLQVWHRALSEQEIAEIAGDRLNLPPDFTEESQDEQLISFWSFNEPEGSFARDRTGRIHGTYMGSVERSCR